MMVPTSNNGTHLKRPLHKLGWVLCVEGLAQSLAARGHQHGLLIFYIKFESKTWVLERSHFRTLLPDFLSIYTISHPLQGLCTLYAHVQTFITMFCSHLPVGGSSTIMSGAGEQDPVLSPSISAWNKYIESDFSCPLFLNFNWIYSFLKQSVLSCGSKSK